MLTLRGEHEKLLLKILQRLLDRLLASISLFIAHLERTRQMLAVLCQSIKLLIFPTEGLIQLLDQVISLLQLIGKPLVLITSIPRSLLLSSRISLLNVQKQLFTGFAGQVVTTYSTSLAIIKH